MKKTIIRCAVGALIGLAISTIISVAISLSIGDGSYYPVVPELIRDCGGEMKAMLVETVCSLIYGAAWAGASVIWEKESWSLLKQTTVHFAICSAATFPIAYFTRWMPRSASGVLLYFGIFIAIYAAIWLSQYASIKKRIAQINEKMKGAEK